MEPRIPTNYIDFSDIVTEGRVEYGDSARVWETPSGEVYCTPGNVVEPNAVLIPVSWDGAVYVRA